RMMRQAMIGGFRHDRSQQKKPGRDAQRPIALPRLSAMPMDDALGRHERQAEFSLQFHDRDEVHIVFPKLVRKISSAGTDAAVASGHASLDAPTTAARRFAE